VSLWSFLAPSPSPRFMWLQVGSVSLCLTVLPIVYSNPTIWLGDLLLITLASSSCPILSPWSCKSRSLLVLLSAIVIASKAATLSLPLTWSYYCDYGNRGDCHWWLWSWSGTEWVVGVGHHCQAQWMGSLAINVSHLCYVPGYIFLFCPPFSFSDHMTSPSLIT